MLCKNKISGSDYSGRLENFYEHRKHKRNDQRGNRII